MERSLRIRLSALPLLVVTAACSMVGSTAGPSTRIPPAPPAGTVMAATPRAEPPSRYGNMSQYEQSGRWYRVMDSSYGYAQRGVASWYGEQFHGRRTSSGEPYDMYQLTAAHRTLPLPTYVRVTNLDNGRSTVLRVNDRGPFADTGRRIIDVSYAAALELEMVGSGTANVLVEAVEPWQERVQ